MKCFLGGENYFLKFRGKIASPESQYTGWDEDCVIPILTLVSIVEVATAEESKAEVTIRVSAVMSKLFSIDCE